MTTKFVDIDQLGAMLRTDFDQAVERTEFGLYRAALRALPLVVEATPSDRGLARGGWQVDKVAGGADLRNDAPHAGILEAGSRPHRPPLEPILRWVVRVFGIGLEGGRRSYSDESDVPARTKAVAWAVTEKIAEHGTEAHWMVRGNMRKLAQYAREEVERMLKAL